MTRPLSCLGAPAETGRAPEPLKNICDVCGAAVNAAGVCANVAALGESFHPKPFVPSPALILHCKIFGIKTKKVGIRGRFTTSLWHPE